MAGWRREEEEAVEEGRGRGRGGGKDGREALKGNNGREG